MREEKENVKTKRRRSRDEKEYMTKGRQIKGGKMKCQFKTRRSKDEKENVKKRQLVHRQNS